MTAPAIVYVDDEPLNLRVFEANFRDRYRVIGCSSGAKALEQLQKLDNVAVLLSDQRMPGMSGVELLEEVRSVNPDIQRMLITAYADMQAVVDAVNRGQVSRYFVKPWSKEDLRVALEDAIRIYTLQSRVRQMESRLVESEKLIALGQVSAGIAHELMNPVSYMSQNVEALRAEISVLTDFVKRHKPDGLVNQTLADLPQILSDVEAGARHIRQIAMGVRRQARGEDDQTTCDLAEVASFAVKLARAEVRQKTKIVLKGESVRVAGGPVKMCQVLLNLIINSAQAMDGMKRPGLITVRWGPHHTRVLLEVEDNAGGIPETLHEKVFEPLFTTKPAGVGTGLGLGICRDIVRGMGGDMQLASREGEGTTVSLKLVPAMVS